MTQSPAGPDDGGPKARRKPPSGLVVAAVVVALEGLGTFAYAIGELLHITPARLVMGATTSAFFALYGLGLVLTGWGVWRLRTWARGPVLLSQLIWLGLAWNFRTGSTKPLSALLATVAVVTLIAMLLPASVAALDRGHRDD